jgi:hypothetical protein
MCQSFTSVPSGFPDEEKERLAPEIEAEYPDDLIVFIRKFSGGAGEQD